MGGLGAAAGVFGEIAGVEEAVRFDVAHGGEEALFEAGVFFFEFEEDVAEGAADCAGFLGAAAGDDGCGEGAGVVAGEVFRDEDEGADEAEVFLGGPGDGGHSAEAAVVHGVAEEGFAEVVGGVAEGDDVGAHLFADGVDGAAAEAAAEVATVAGLFFDEAEAGFVADVEPFDVALFEIVAEGSDGGEELALLDGEGADLKIDGGAFLEEQEDFEEGDGVLAAGEADGDAVSIADHVELLDGLADFSEQCFFEIHYI